MMKANLKYREEGFPTASYMTRTSSVCHVTTACKDYFLYRHTVLLQHTYDLLALSPLSKCATYDFVRRPAILSFRPVSLLSQIGLIPPLLVSRAIILTSCFRFQVISVVRLAVNMLSILQFVCISGETTRRTLILVPSPLAHHCTRINKSKCTGGRACSGPCRPQLKGCICLQYITRDSNGPLRPSVGSATCFIQ